MGSVSVSSCRCCMFVSCVHPVAVLNAAFCMTCSLLMLVEDTIYSSIPTGKLAFDISTKVISDLVYARPGAGQYSPEDQDC